MGNSFCWYWCFGCNRVFKSDEEQPSACPHCEAPTKDLWTWQKILDVHPEYPQKPKPKGIYRLNIKRGLGEAFGEEEGVK